MRTQANSSVQDNVKFLYNPAIARELIEYNHKDDLLKFTATGFMTNPNYNIKKMNFLLFINHRLVESSAMKKAIELIYAAYLPKGTHPFVYLSLEIAPENIDVNVSANDSDFLTSACDFSKLFIFLQVHPTKHEVHFLHQDEIIDKLQQSMDARLLGSNSSRTFYTQPVLPGNF